MDKSERVPHGETKPRLERTALAKYALKIVSTVTAMVRYAGCVAKSCPFEDLM